MIIQGVNNTDGTLTYSNESITIGPNATVTIPNNVLIDFSREPQVIYDIANGILSIGDTVNIYLGQNAINFLKISIESLAIAPVGTAGTASTSIVTVQGIAGMTALDVDGSAVTQPISVASLPLPSGAATGAKQDTGNTSLSSIDGKLGSLGQKAMTGSVPIVIASDQSAVPITGSISVSNNANGTPGSTAPSEATQIGGSDGTNLRALKVSNIGVLSVDGSASTQPVSGTVTITPSGTQDVNNKQVNGNTVSTGNGVVGTGVQRVAIASDNTAFTVNSAQSGTWTVQPGNTANTTAWKVDGSAVTQPVSGTVTITPSGTQDVNNKQVNGNTVSTGNGVVGTGVQRVAIASDNTAFSVNATPKLGATAVAPTTVSVGNTATTISSSNANNVLRIISNAGNKTVYLGFTNAVTTSNGFPLLPAGTYTEDRYSGDIFGIVTSGTCTVTLQEARV